MQASFRSLLVRQRLLSTIEIRCLASNGSLSCAMKLCMKESQDNRRYRWSTDLLFATMMTVRRISKRAWNGKWSLRIDWRNRRKHQSTWRSSSAPRKYHPATGVLKAHVGRTGSCTHRGVDELTPRSGASGNATCLHQTPPMWWTKDWGHPSWTKIGSQFVQQAMRGATLYHKFCTQKKHRDQRPQSRWE